MVSLMRLSKQKHPTFHDAITELPEVVSRRESHDPRVNETGFLRTRDDYESNNVNRIVVVKRLLDVDFVVLFVSITRSSLKHYE